MAMKLRSIIASVALLSLVAIPTATSANAATSRYISVNAEGTVKVVPDAVKIMAQVTVVDGTNAGALAKANTTSAAVRKAITSNGVSTKDIGKPADLCSEHATLHFLYKLYLRRLFA